MSGKITSSLVLNFNFLWSSCQFFFIHIDVVKTETLHSIETINDDILWCYAIGWLKSRLTVSRVRRRRVSRKMYDEKSFGGRFIIVQPMHKCTSSSTQSISITDNVVNGGTAKLMSSKEIIANLKKNCMCRYICCFYRCLFIIR